MAIEEKRIEGPLSRPANSLHLVVAGCADSGDPIPWLGNKALRLQIGWPGAGPLHRKASTGIRVRDGLG